MKNKIVKEISLEQLHQYYYERFAILHRFLTDNNIEYYAVAGTLLGAIRHNGIIPWDEDMDIAMTRENYNKFIQIASKLNGPYLRINNYHFSKRISHSITKISLVGIRRNKSRSNDEAACEFHIDVFPLDYVFKDKEQQLKIVKKIKHIYDILYFKTRSFTALNMFKGTGLVLAKLIYLPFTYRMLCKRIDKLATSPSRSPEANKELLWISSGIYPYEKETHSSQCFGKPQSHIFGDIMIDIPERYDEFLRITYGDNYMTPVVRRDKAMEGIFVCDDFCEINNEKHLEK